jgi:hypothetical protein
MIKINAVCAVSGMIIDILGAFFIARSFILKKPASVFSDVKSLGSWGFCFSPGARDLLLSWLIQGIEARTGAMLMFVGFTFQILAQFLSTTEYRYGFLIVAGVALAAVVALFRLPIQFVSRASKQALDYYQLLRLEDKDFKDISEREQELKKIHASPRIWLHPTKST